MSSGSFVIMAYPQAADGDGFHPPATEASKKYAES
jgi:hypothetical protein